MGKQERVSWIALIVNTLIATWYFGRVLTLPAEADLLGPAMTWFVTKVVVLTIVFTIVCEVLLRIVQTSTGATTDAAERDERDALISLKATRNAHLALGFAVVAVLVQISLLEWATRYRNWRRAPDTILELLGTGPLQAVHVALLLLAALAIAAITLNASRVFYYRRGY